MTRRRRKTIPWSQLPRSRRKHDFIRIKNDCAKHAKFLGGLFTSHDVIEKNAWLDIYFLSKKRKGVFYNCTIDIARHVYAENMSGRAWDESYELMPREWDFKNLFEKDAETGHSMLRRDPREDEPQEVFGGMKRWDWIKKREVELCDERSHPVFERVEFARDYGFGIGLHVTVDEPFLTIEILERFIRRFWDSGETAFKGTHPLTYASKDINFGLASNAVGVDIEEWATPLAPSGEKTSSDEEIQIEKALEPQAPSPKKSPRMI